MPIRPKTSEQIEKMRAAGRIVRRVLDRLGQMVSPGVTTAELDAEAQRLCKEMGGTCLFKGVPGHGGAGPFPGAVCVSINEQVVHGIPSRRAIKAGDVVSLDFGVRLAGWCGDAASTYLVGPVPPKVQRLADVTRNGLDMAIAMMRPGERWSNIARTMQEYIEGEGFAVVREFVGHGIGSQMHEEPQVPNFVSRELLAHDIVLAEGMTLAVEPMVNMGSTGVVCERDGWTIVTKDGLPSVHFEHTIAVTAGDADVLTDGR